jgi:hypothetical protein
LLDVWSLNLYVDWLLFFNIHRYHFLYLDFLINDELFSIRFLHNYFNLLKNCLSISFYEMSCFHNNLFGDLLYNLFFLYNWHLNDLFFINFVRNYFLNKLCDYYLFFLSVSDEFWDFSFYVDYFSVGNNMRNLPLNLNIFVLL